MDFDYGMLEDAKREIQNICNKKESIYGPMIEIIERKANGKLDSPLI